MLFTLTLIAVSNKSESESKESLFTFILHVTYDFADKRYSALKFMFVFITTI